MAIALRPRRNFISQGIGGFLEGMTQSAQTRQLQDANLRAEETHAMNMAGAQRRMADEAAARAVIPQVLTGPPATAEVMPGRPAGFSPIATGFTPDMDPEAAAFAGMPAHQPTPAVPPVVESAHTMGSIAANAGGPANLAALLRTAEGRQVVDSLNPITEVEFQTRQRKRKGREDYQRLMGEAHAARAAGEELRAVDTEASALRALADAVDNPEPVFRQIRELMRERNQLFKDKDDRELANQEMPRLAAAKAAYEENPTPETYSKFLEAVAGVKSTHVRKRADILLQQVEKDAMQQMRANKLTQRVAKVHTGVGQELSRQRDAGEAIDLGKAYKRALAADPQAAGEYLTIVMTGEKALPDAVKKAIFGEFQVPDSIAKEADAIVVSQGAVRGTPAYYTKLSDQITTITKARQKATASQDDETRTTTQILQYRGQLAREQNTLQTRLAGMTNPNDPARPNIEARIRAIETEMSATSETLRQRGVAPNLAAAPPAPGVNPAELSDDQKAAIRVTLKKTLEDLGHRGKRLVDLTTEEQAKVQQEVNRRLTTGVR